MTPIFAILDHLVYATPSLEETCRALGRLLGVTPQSGGVHPRWGTRNALLALGPRMYLEVIGPDPDQPPPSGPRPFGIDDLLQPRLVTWVCRADDLAAVVEEARRLGVDLGEVSAGNRRRPDGSLLSWTATDPLKPREAGLVPFFINWGESSHPAGSAPAGCSLLSLQAEHPEAGRLKPILAGLGLDLPLEKGTRPKLSARLASSRGQAELS